MTGQGQPHLIHERAFDKPEDLAQMQALLAKLRHQERHTGTFLFGNLVYEMHHPLTGFEEEKDIRVWTSDDGGLCGFVFFRPPDNPEFCIQPDLYGSRMEDEMIAWSLARARERNATSLETSCLDGDAARAGFLTRHGFTQTRDNVCVLLERSLYEPLPEWEPPDGYSVVTLAERPECACGIPDSDIGLELYRRVQAAPGYRADLDVRAFYHDTDLASGCICWYDDVDNYGQFEPVGTKEEHRRKGLASAVMIKAMENLRGYGADRVLVWTGQDNTRGLGLYQSLGFRLAYVDYAWKRQV